MFYQLFNVQPDRVRSHVCVFKALLFVFLFSDIYSIFDLVEVLITICVLDLFPSTCSLVFSLIFSNQSFIVKEKHRWILSSL